MRQPIPRLIAALALGMLAGPPPSWAQAVGAPAAPSALLAGAPSESLLSLRWNDNSVNEERFRIERRTGAGSFVEVGTTGANVAFFRDTGLAPSTTYCYRVRAASLAGNSAYSGEACATTLAPASPLAPSDLLAVAVSEGTVRLRWRDNSTGETGFKLERRLEPGPTFVQIATTEANIAFFGDLGLAASTTYCYRVRATGPAGDSAYSSEACATTFAPAPPRAPSSLLTVARQESVIKMSWVDASDNETGFAVERRTGIGAAFVQIATTGPDVRFFADRGLAPATTACYRVRAFNAVGSSGFSNESCATTAPAGAGLASAWDLGIRASVGGVSTQGRIDRFGLPEPTGGATVPVAGLPVSVTRTTDRFLLSADSSFVDASGCRIRIVIQGSAPIQRSPAGALAAGPVAGTHSATCQPTTTPILGAFVARSLDVTATPPTTVVAVAGTVLARTPAGIEDLLSGASLPAGRLIASLAAATAGLASPDGSQLDLSPRTAVTFVPPADGTAEEDLANVIRGTVRFRRGAEALSSGRPRVSTPTAVIRPLGTDFTTTFTQMDLLGVTTVQVQAGIVEVTDRKGQLTTVTAGAEASFEDFVPRVSLILPVDGGSVQAGRVNTLSWLRFPGAAGYLIEYTLSPAGFSRPNSPEPEPPTAGGAGAAVTIPIGGDQFTDAEGIIEFPLIPPEGAGGIRAHWRVFPVDEAGAILPGTTASDSAVVFVQ